MKKTVSIVLAIVMMMSLVTLMLPGISAETSSEDSTRTASYAVQKPVIDGNADDAIWSTTEQLDFSAPATGSQTAYAKVLWDETGLYILTCITPNTKVSYHKAVTYYISEQYFDGMDAWWNYPSAENENAVKYNLYKGNYAFRVVPDTTSSNYTKYEKPLIDNGSIAFKMVGGPLEVNPLDLTNVEWKVAEDKGSEQTSMTIEMHIPIQTHVQFKENATIKFGVGTTDASTSKAQATGMSISNNAVVATSPAVLGDLKLIANPSAKISGASLVIGSDLTVNYYADVASSFVSGESSDWKMRFTRNEKSVTVDGVYNDAEERYMFSYTGITPQCMGDNIKAELLYGESSVSAKDSYSVLEYLRDLHVRDSANAKLNTLIADLLEYGAAAQNYMNYNTDALVNTDDWVSAEKTAEFVAPVETAPVIEGSIDQNNRFTSVGVELANTNQIFFRFRTADAANATITIKKGSGDEVEIPASEWIADGDSYLVYTDGINASGHDILYTATLTVGGQTQSISYSINAYASVMHGDTQVGELVRALYNLGVSAKAYQ
ncbi:MAG: sugar-binding protein [Eubacteriales bacterium]